jgi:hypothetical protein
VVAELEGDQVAQAAGAMWGAVDEWVLAVGGVTRTIRSPPSVLLLPEKEKERVLWIGTEP